ncbi:MAG TPA: tetraacyldisaccharide 4'-kinase [Steroidobacteraceae bacterium]
MSLDARLQRLWYGPAWRSVLLWPLELLFRLLVGCKALLYRVALLRVHSVAAPVVVVGNLTVGGTGKTPVAAWLARQLALRGHAVGVVLRGHGGTHTGAPRVVHPDDDAAVVGDEALLHARRGPQVVVIGADRVAAAGLAVAQGAQIVVCDDGLQHTRLARDFEIAVVDATRGFGNGHLLPAGPLREPAGRLETVDAVVLTERGDESRAGRTIQPRSPLVLEARLRIGDAVNLVTAERRPLAAFAGQAAHAVAAVGHPEAFFAALRASGIDLIEHPLPDHADIPEGTLPTQLGTTVLMTEKDAVKCRSRAQAGWWWVDLEVEVDRNSAAQLLTVLLERTHLTGAGVRLG